MVDIESLISGPVTLTDEEEIAVYGLLKVFAIEEGNPGDILLTITPEQRELLRIVLLVGLSAINKNAVAYKDPD